MLRGRQRVAQTSHRFSFHLALTFAMRVSIYASELFEYRMCPRVVNYWIRGCLIGFHPPTLDTNRL